MSDVDDLVVGLAVFALGIALILWGLIFWAIISFTISAIVASYRFNRYLKEARATFDEVQNEVGANTPADEVLRAVWGAGVELKEDGFKSPTDWFNATILGVEDE